jgi:methionyl-tRNA formyltransferase
MNFVFFGTAQFGIPSLDALIQEGHSLQAVVTNPPRRAGRGRKLRYTAVHSYCRENLPDVPVFTPHSLKDPDFISHLRECNASAFVVVAFSILPTEVFSIPPRGTFNIHAALLPRYRGPAPIHRAIERGEKVTGVTVFKIDSGIDTGNILVRKQTEIRDRETTPRLYERLSRLGADAVCEAFSLLESGTFEYAKQNPRNATTAPLLKKEEARIDWRLPASVIERRIRAFQPFPGTFTSFDGRRLQVLKATVYPARGEAGRVIKLGGGECVVACGEDALRLERVKPEGRKEMEITDYLNGTSLYEGYRFEATE